MIGFSQANDLSQMFTPNIRERSLTDCSNQTGSTNDFCDEIDEIMKHETEDVILIDDSLPITPLDLNLDSISDLLEHSRSSSLTIPTLNFTQSLNINDLSTTVNNSQSNSRTTTSAYSSLSVSPKLTTLSLNNNNNFQQFIQSNNSHLPLYVQQQDNSILGASRPFELQSNTNGPSDVKRFRSASMNDGPSLQQEQQNKLDPHFFDPYRFKSSAYINPPSYQEKPTSPSDGSSNSVWPFTCCPRPPSNSFSEVENQQQQLRLHPQLTSNLSSPSTIHYRNRTRFTNNINFPQQTLYSINQSTNENSTPPTTKRLSLADFPVEESRDDVSSPSCTIEQQSEPELWSDIEQNSSDHIHDNDNTFDDDDETNTSFDYPKVFESGSSPPRFWKYNVQSKGPKTKRMLYLKERDPHLHREFSDPVYQIKLTQTSGHTFNKLRKGDGNDVTPNPTKLYQLGKQINDLLKNSSSVYQGIYNVEHHTNPNDSVEAKKEKNKLASKTCRLRKKAQHEANKLKLQGLNKEHKSLIDIIASIKMIILKRYQDDQISSSNQSFEAALDQLIATKYSQAVAGNADGFVEATINEYESLYSQKPT